MIRKPGRAKWYPSFHLVTPLNDFLCIGLLKNKAGYTAQDAPSTRLKITWDRRTDRRTDGRTNGPTDTTCYRDATAHLKSNDFPFNHLNYSHDLKLVCGSNEVNKYLYEFLYASV